MSPSRDPVFASHDAERSRLRPKPERRSGERHVGRLGRKGGVPPSQALVARPAHSLHLQEAFWRCRLPAVLASRVEMQTESSRVFENTTRSLPPSLAKSRSQSRPACARERESAFQACCRWRACWTTAMTLNESSCRRLATTKLENCEPVCLQRALSVCTEEPNCLRPCLFVTVQPAAAASRPHERNETSAASSLLRSFDRAEDAAAALRCARIACLNTVRCSPPIRSIIVAETQKGSVPCFR